MKHASQLTRFLAVAMLSIALPVLAADDAGRIRAGTKSWVESFNGGNAGAVVALYSDDAVLMPPGELPARGTAAIKEAIAKEIAGAKKGGVTFALGTGDEVSVSGDMAWHSGAYFILDKSGKTVETGKYLEAWERKGGKWRIVRDMWNANGNVPAAAAASAAPAPAAAPKKK
jgi:ketosteroid isomerase-like protein